MMTLVRATRRRHAGVNADAARALLLAAAGFASGTAAAQSMPGMAMPGDPAPAARPQPATPTEPMPMADGATPMAGMAGDASMMSMRPASARPGECERIGEAGTPVAIAQDEIARSTAYRCLSQTGSGTSRLPAGEAGMNGLHAMAGGWMLMAHGYAWGMVTDQGGPRGQDEAVIQSMAMLQADRDLAPGAHLQLRTMLSLEPLMGARGYPNLFATGETANGRPLVDRQHPHDLVMELSGRVDIAAAGGAFFLYGGPVAEPALGPSAFMHRGSAENLPLAPIAHHWFDSTHITYGVVTAGYATPHLQLEASAFRGREPDEHRWNIESPRLDSWSVRASWSPSIAWLVQASHGRLASPEAGHPGEDEGRTTASVQFARGGVTALAAWSLKDRLPGPALPAELAEVNWAVRGPHALFGRVEHVANDELFPDPASPLHDRIFRVTRFEGGYAYRLALAGPLGASLGGSLAAYAKPAALDAAYGTAPVSWTLFARLSLGH